ncbi:thiamine diphosphate-binding protein [Rhizophagus diaphanus]|nr:thiamine diphosphate-binding protein [Rhizophagus diaphanus] [Rhizophagus sp. MUCL 43196]
MSKCILTIWSRTLRHISYLNSNAVLFRDTFSIKSRYLIIHSLGAIRNKATAVNSSQPQDSVSQNDFSQRNATNYIEGMYEAWLRDPSSIHLSWQIYFKNMDSNMKTYRPSPTIVPLTGLTTSLSPSTSQYDDHMKVQLLVRAYQVRELDPRYYGFTEKDLDKKFSLGPGILPAFAETEKKDREIVDACKTIYRSTIGMNILIFLIEQYDWICSKIEIPKQYDYTLEVKRMILDRLIWSDSFERFDSTKYSNERRFGLEGCESLIPGMKALIDRSVDLGIESLVLGMAHRGRLNVLSNVVRKPNESIFNEFSGIEPSDEGSGDALGMNYDRPTPSGKHVHLSLAVNPAHLEAVDPVVLGKTPQGVVYETMGFHDLPNYTTGGTVHLVVNNQIGFTTDPRFARSTPYCSDVAKVVGIDWPTAEGLALGSLLLEGKHVRLSGQDVERGTFSQRHAVLHDQVNETQYVPLNDLRPDQAKFSVCNSSLSEFVILASGETKWLQRTGLVVLLPHGYDGQGPEHSSGRLERFLQLCNHHPLFAFQSNDIVIMDLAYCIHVKESSSSSNGAFIYLCSGQVYYALLRAHEQNKMDHVAIYRLEQICPFPYDLLSQHIDKYPNAELIWAQEEPLNGGAWTYVAPRIRTLMNHSKRHEGKTAKPATRLPSASPATGNKKQHIQEEHDLLSQALIGQIIEPKKVVSGVPVWE